MAVFYLVLIWRVYAFVAAIFILSALAQLLFSPSKKNAKELFLSLPFIAVWPIALFSPKGRSKLFKRLTKI